MNEDRLLEELSRRRPEKAPEPRLGPIKELLDYLGNPQACAPVIHVTGTNGKTSTSRIAASLLRALGLRVGLLTSPHLIELNERIQIDLNPIDADRLWANWEQMQFQLHLVDERLVQAGEPRLTFFEALTALAFVSFAEAAAEVMVLEVGMGGEWDATNAARAQVATIGPVAFDHVLRLGGSLEEIAATKAGIIKPGAVTVSARQTESVRKILRFRALESGGQFYQFGRDFSARSLAGVGGQLVDFYGLRKSYFEVFLPLQGCHQVENAALALASVEGFLSGYSPLDPKVVELGMAKASSPGRLQVVTGPPTVLVDAAHNPHGAMALARALRESFSFSGVAGVFGAFADKDVGSVLKILGGVVERFVLTEGFSERAMPATRLGQIAGEVLDPQRFELEPSVNQALDRALSWAGQGLNRAVLVTGSVALVGRVMESMINPEDRVQIQP